MEFLMSHPIDLNFKDVQRLMNATNALECAVGRDLDLAFLVSRAWDRFWRECAYYEQGHKNEKEVLRYRELLFTALADFEKIES
jgi:hypothetical protein